MPVTVGDVATTLRRPITSEQDRNAVELWLKQAALAIRLRFGDRASELDQEAVDFAVLQAVAERFRAPADAASSTSYSVDDAQVTKRWDVQVGSGAMPDSWLDWLAENGLPDGGAGEAFSIRLGGGGRAW